MSFTLHIHDVPVMLRLLLGSASCGFDRVCCTKATDQHNQVVITTGMASQDKQVKRRSTAASHQNLPHFEWGSHVSCGITAVAKAALDSLGIRACSETSTGAFMLQKGNGCRG